MPKTTKPLCVVCHDKPARLGRKQGYPANLICSQQCAVRDFFERALHYELCKICGEWTEVCGECTEESEAQPD